MLTNFKQVAITQSTKLARNTQKDVNAAKNKQTRFRNKIRVKLRLNTIWRGKSNLTETL